MGRSALNGEIMSFRENTKKTGNSSRPNRSNRPNRPNKPNRSKWTKKPNMGSNQDYNKQVSTQSFREVSNADFDVSSMTPFTELGLEVPILRALKTLKFKEPTSIQEQAIPHALAGKDILAGSETGSGKTLAFGASIIQNARTGKGVQALILTPTRELAEQVSSSLKVFAQNKHLNVAAIYGGVGINPQIRNLGRCEIVVATPGRMLDHINRGTAKLSRVKTLVLDEADTMLDMGFIRDVEKIIKACPSDERQTLMFSATLTDGVQKLSRKHTKNPVKLFTKSSVDPKKLTQISYEVSQSLKFSVLAHLLKNEESELAMVFCNTRRNTDSVSKDLNKVGIRAHAIHGGLSQDKRTKVIRSFHLKKVDVLVCTDVAARGLDIKGVSHVYNYEVPIESNQYVHRIGRTARAGKEGKAINLVLKRDQRKFLKVLSDNSLTVTRAKAPYVERADVAPAREQRQRRFN